MTLTQVIPWFLHVYTHTLTATAGEGNGTRPVEVLRSSYKPSVARTSAHLWELTLLLPGEQRTTLKVDFERGYLRYSEYPADPYRGFEVPAAVIEGNLAAPHANSEGPAWVHLVDQSSDQGPAARAGRTVRIHTEAMNVQMPSPDFSMPYNVISISSTIIAISFGVFFKAGVYQTIPTPPDAPAPPVRAVSVYRLIVTPTAAKSISFGSPHVRCTPIGGRACGEPLRNQGNCPHSIFILPLFSRGCSSG